jgi:hypothetical protein
VKGFQMPIKDKPPANPFTFGIGDVKDWFGIADQVYNGAVAQSNNNNAEAAKQLSGALLDMLGWF